VTQQLFFYAEIVSAKLSVNRAKNCTEQGTLLQLSLQAHGGSNALLVCLHYYWPYKRGTSQAQQSHRVLCHNDSLTKLSTENLIHGHYFLTFHGDTPLLPSSSAAQKLRSALLETNPHWVLWEPFHCDQLTGLVSNLSSLLQLAVLVTPAFFCICCVSSEQQSFNSAAGWVYKVALCDFRLHTFVINIHKRENTHMKETRIYAAYSYNTEISHHALSLEKTIIKRNKRSWVSNLCKGCQGTCDTHLVNTVPKSIWKKGNWYISKLKKINEFPSDPSNFKSSTKIQDAASWASCQ
jgi:hypothetical protein